MAKLRYLVLRQGGVFLALFLALSLSPVGLAVAAGTIGSLDIINGSVKAVDLGTGAVTNSKLSGNAVTSAKVANGSIGAADIADNAVTSAKMANGSITNADIATGAAIAASKINRTGLNADLLDGVNSSALVKNNTAATQTLAGKLAAPDLAYSPAKEGVLIIPVVGANIVGPYSMVYDTAIQGSSTSAVDWYEGVSLPAGATITGLGLGSIDVLGGQSYAELVKWTEQIARVDSTVEWNWHLDSTLTIAPGFETFDDEGVYHVRVHMNGGRYDTLQTGSVRINYTYSSPGD